MHHVANVMEPNADNSAEREFSHVQASDQDSGLPMSPTSGAVENTPWIMSTPLQPHQLSPASDMSRVMVSTTTLDSVISS